MREAAEARMERSFGCVAANSRESRDAGASEIGRALSKMECAVVFRSAETCAGQEVSRGTRKFVRRADGEVK